MMKHTDGRKYRWTVPLRHQTITKYTVNGDKHLDIYLLKLAASGIPIYQ